MYYKNKKNAYKAAIDQFLQELLDNKEILKQDLKLLSGAMKAYNEITLAGRFHPKKRLDEFDNPKYPFEVLEGDAVFHDVMWDAWGYWVKETSDFEKHGKFFPSPHPLELKKDKTLEDFLNLHKDPAYTYSRLFKDKYCVYNLLFNCPNSGGYQWLNGHPYHSDLLEQEKFSNPKDPTELFKSLATFIKTEEFLLGKKVHDQKISDHHQSYRFLLDNMHYIPQAEKELIISELVEITQKESQKTGKDPQPVIDHFQSYLEERVIHPYAHISRVFSKADSTTENLPKNVHPSFITGAIEWCEYVVKNSDHKETIDSAKRTLKKYSKQS